ncbi:MAG: hypothetical protein ACI30K_08375 [Muribaculaceae bacterium]
MDKRIRKLLCCLFLCSIISSVIPSYAWDPNATYAFQGYSVKEVGDWTDITLTKDGDVWYTTLTPQTTTTLYYKIHYNNSNLVGGESRNADGVWTSGTWDANESSFTNVKLGVKYRFEIRLTDNNNKIQARMYVDPDDLYLIGDVNGGAHADANYKFTRENNVYTLKNVRLNNDWFKIKDGSSDWSSASFNAGAGNTSMALDTDYAIYSGGSNCGMSSDNGYVDITFTYTPGVNSSNATEIGKIRVSKATDTYTLKVGSTEANLSTSDDGATYTGTTTLSASQAITLLKNGTETLYASETATYTGGDATYTMTGTSGGVTTGTGEFSGNYTFTYTPADQKLTISGATMTVPTYTVIVFGDVEGGNWSGSGITLTQKEGTTTYTGTVKMKEGSQHFRVKIDDSQYGPQTDEADESVTIGTAKQMYNNYKTALTVSDALKYIFTVDATAKTVKLDYINFVIRTSAADNFSTDAYTFSTTDGKTYTCTGVTLDAGTQFKLKEAGDEVWLGKSNLTVTGADITAGDTDTDNIKLVSGIKNATVTFDVTNYSLTIVSEEEVKQFPDPGENYIWGDATLTFEYRNDDNPSAAWTSIPLTFDKYDSDTNPYGLEAYASEPFEVAVNNLDWRIRTSTGYIVRKGASTAVSVWLQDFCKDLTAVNNTFEGLTPGVKYRIVIDTTHGDGVSKANPKIGIFAAESSYPWGEIDELYVHGNFSGYWPDNNNTDEANHLKYYPDSKIWSVSFTTGEKQSFSSELGATGTGFEFCLRNKYNYIWFKDIYNFPINEWVSDELKIQTVDNNGNYYSNNFEANTTYMLQVRINPEDESGYQIRIVKALSAESLYIVGKDTSNGWNASQPDNFTQYKDENGDAIEGRYYYTINYTGEGFKIATAKGASINDWDPVNAALLSPADNTANNGNNAFNATIDKPYTYTAYGDKDKGTGNWVISDGAGYYSIILDEIAQTVTIVRPSIRVVISNISLNTYSDELSNEHAQALTTTDKMPKGATDETPVYYNNVNYLGGTINILAEQIPTGLSLTISNVKVTVNGTDTYTIAGTFAEGVNVVKLLPYGGTHATYQVLLEYYIGNDDSANEALQTVTSDIVTINLVGDFEAPVTFDATDMKRQFYHNGETRVVSALVEAPVEFSSVYNVYPGFAVTVAQDLTDDATIIGNNGKPIGTDWEDMAALKEVSYLSTYDGTANTNWSSAALNSNTLPVAVPTTLEFADLSDAAKMPQIKYELFGHYPIIDLVGAKDPCGGYLIGSGVVAKIARTAETPVTTLSPSTDVANYRLSVYTTTADRSVTTKFSTTDITTGIADFEAEAADGEEIYFNLQGVRITNPQSGLYIRYNGRTFDKVYIR